MQDLWADTSLICRITWHRRWFWQKMVVVARPINCPGCISSIVPWWGSRREPHRTKWLTVLQQLTLRNMPRITKPSSSAKNFWECKLYICCIVWVKFNVFFGVFFSFLDTRLSSTIETYWVISYLNSPNKYKN